MAAGCSRFSGSLTRDTRPDGGASAALRRPTFTESMLRTGLVRASVQPSPRCFAHLKARPRIGVVGAANQRTALMTGQPRGGGERTSGCNVAAFSQISLK